MSGGMASRSVRLMAAHKPDDLALRGESWELPLNTQTLGRR